MQASVLVTPLVANYLELRGDTLVLFEEGSGRGIWSVTLDKVQRLESSVGVRNMYRPYIVKGTLLGAGAGAVGGLLFAASFSPSDPSREYSRPLTASIGALVGAGIGALVGSRGKVEQFTPVPLPRRVAAGPNGHGGILVSVAY